MTNKILLLGNTGQLGWELHRTLLTLGEITALDYPQVNMADPNNIREICRDVKPNLILNATAYTNVNKAETEPELVMAINGIGPGILAEEAQNLNAGLVHFSTDYVFDGEKGSSYTEEDKPNPINVYGETKLAGERAVQDVGGAYLIFRTSWVYSLRRPSFVTKILQWARKYETLRIVDDQISSPTWARTLAEASIHVITLGKSDINRFMQDHCGIYHLTDDGYCSRFEWTKAIVAYDPQKEEQIVKEILPAKTSEFPTPAIRPLLSNIQCSKFENTFNMSLPAWKTCLALSMSS